ncbi:MAG: amino acid carrier protein [Planctomycetota bacterium]
MQAIESFVNTLNGLLFSDVVIYALLGTGLLFTIWTAFGQWRALTHGTAVVRGRYDDSNDPGAINHFQALSTALSATVGLGNIAGVAVAVALGGPGAVFWMWVIGVLGMSLKMTEVTQSMLYRNTSDPDNPHGGPMFVAKYGFGQWGLGWLGSTIGTVFVITLIISAITGGNMFQAWNVANTTRDYFGISQLVTGLVLAGIVAVVIIGGIRVIGRVTSIIVPFMCVIYLLAGLFVLVINIGEIPGMLGEIVMSGLGFREQPASGAFLGGSFFYALQWGVKRALFSSEAGQGSAPIAHSAARTDEPAREGVVAGLEPFIDTIVVCTVTALVIMASGAYDRESEASFAEPFAIVETTPGVFTIDDTPVAQLPPKTDDARRVQSIGSQQSDWREKETLFVRVMAQADADSGSTFRRINGRIEAGDEGLFVDWGELESDVTPVFATAADGSSDFGIYGDYAGSSLTAHAFDRIQPNLGKYLVTAAIWLFAISTMISWSYYGEQGIVFIGGLFRSRHADSRPEDAVDANASGDAISYARADTPTAGLDSPGLKVAVLIYKLVYCAIIVIVCVPGLIVTDAQLDMWTTLGLGVMLVVNIPLMWVFAPKAMSAYHAYIGRLRRGELDSEPAPVGEKPD